MRDDRPKSAHCIREPYYSETNSRGSGHGPFGVNQNLFREESVNPYASSRTQKHHKSQHCVYVNDTAHVEPAKCGIGGTKLNYR